MEGEQSVNLRMKSASKLTLLDHRRSRHHARSAGPGTAQAGMGIDNRVSSGALFQQHVHAGVLAGAEIRGVHRRRLAGGRPSRCYEAEDAELSQQKVSAELRGEPPPLVRVPGGPPNPFW